MSSENLHEPAESLSGKTKDMHRAIVSLMEELEAVDWYQQRAEACGDEALKEVLLHNKREEIEHAMMVLEWIRRNEPTFATNVDTYVGASGPILEVEAADKGEGDKSAGSAGDAAASSGSLGIGSLKKKVVRK